MLQFEFEGEGSPNDEELRAFLKQMISEEKFAKLIMDEEAIRVQENKSSNQDFLRIFLMNFCLVDLEDKWGPLKSVRNWTLTAIALILLVGIIVLLFMCTFRSRSQTYVNIFFCFTNSQFF